jgi:spore coat protein CotH
MYGSGIVNVIELELPQSSYDALVADPEGDYQPATFSFAATEGTPGSVGAFSTPQQVEVRLKGGLGSFRPLGEKAGFKLKFPKAAPFRGLRKMTLNSMVQDPTMLHETLAYETFRAVGVPAPRTSFALLLVNGVDYGMHLNLETLDKVALEKRFGPFAEPPQHLYEGEYEADVTPAKKALFEVDEGDDEDLADLEALVAAVGDGSAPDWSDRVAPHADLDEMTLMWIVERYLGHWDGYSGPTGGGQLPNNYYLLSDPLGKFQMLPWGTDQTWEDHLSFEGDAGELFDRCLADSSCAALYRSAGTALLETAPTLGLDAAARCISARLRPWQEVEPDTMKFYGDDEIATAVAATREFIAERPAELATWLAVPPPGAGPPDVLCPPYPADEPEDDGEPDDEEPGTTPGGTAPAGTPAAGTAGGGGAAATASQPSTDPPRARFGLRRIHLEGRRIEARVQVPADGRLTLTVTAMAGGAKVCSERIHVAGPGWTTLSCRLSGAIRRQLEDRSVRVSVGAGFKPDSGAPSQSAARAVKLQ